MFFKFTQKLKKNLIFFNIIALLKDDIAVKMLDESPRIYDRLLESQPLIEHWRPDSDETFTLRVYYY